MEKQKKVDSVVISCGGFTSELTFGNLNLVVQVWLQMMKEEDG